MCLDEQKERIRTYTARAVSEAGIRKSTNSRLDLVFSKSALPDGFRRENAGVGVERNERETETRLRRKWKRRPEQSRRQQKAETNEAKIGRVPCDEPERARDGTRWRARSFIESAQHECAWWLSPRDNTAHSASHAHDPVKRARAHGRLRQRYSTYGTRVICDTLTKKL